MIEKFASVCSPCFREFLDLNHTGEIFFLMSLITPRFARSASIGVGRKSELGH